MRFGSVCSGIEAASVAWEPLGWKAAWFAEIEPFPSAVLAHHYPTVPNLGDMTTIADKVRAGEVEAPDVLVGGTPCQAFSVAGLRNSLDDARGQLSLEFVRLANEIDSARSVRGHAACTILWENVPGVLSTKDNAFGCFLGALAGEDGPILPAGKKWTNAGCVFGPQRTVAWRVTDAQYFGVAQRRRRVFVVASADPGFDPANVLFESEGVRRDTAPRREKGEGAAVCPTLRAGGNRTGGDRPPGTDVDTCTSLIVQSVSLRGREGGGTAELGGDLANCLRASSGGGDKPHVLVPHLEGCLTPSLPQRIRIHGIGGTSPTLQAEEGRGHGVPSIFDEAITVAARDVAQCLTSNYGKQCDNSDTALGPNVAISNMAVRRLTPVECERLQAFPDGYTQVPHRGKPAADGPRYKALGNSMCVSNMRKWGRQIEAEARRTKQQEAA